MRYQTPLTIPMQPMHEQIATQVSSAVEHGLLASHARLPSTRTLAELLGVSRGVVATAYELLLTRGYLECQPGSGTYVAEPRGRTLDRAPGPPASPATPVDLRPGQLNPEAFPLSPWRAAWRQASFRRPPAHALPPLGLPELRRAIADHVSHTRGMSLAGRDVVVTGGTPHGLRVALDALGLRGSHVAIEEPVPPALHRVVGGDPAALAVDGDGARVDAIPAACRAIVVSPDAPVPLDHVLSASRRRDAAAWAADSGGHMIEIGGDAVFRANQLPRLLTLAGDASVLLGGFCERLTPTLKLGYAIVPRELAANLGRRIADHVEQPPYVTQHAVASLLQDGTVVRLMHRLGRLYPATRRLVHLAVTGIPDGDRDAVGTEVSYLPDRLDADHAASELLARGVRVETLTPYHFSGRPARAALVVGYGHPPDAAPRRALPILSDVLRGTG